MTIPAELQRLTPAARAQLIYGAARQGNELALWRAALGDGERATAVPATTGGNPLLDFQSLLQALHSTATPPVSANSVSAANDHGLLALGANQSLEPQITAAAARTGMPAAALAAIVDAESAKSASGAWISQSRNPRSSAVGLGQFLNSTWLGEAERPGTALHDLVTAKGWLGPEGKVAGGAREAVLALRADPAISIDAVADFARFNLDRLAKKGATIGTGVEAIARTAWLAHHLGAGDALQFLRGGLTDGRAGHLLAAQVGGAAAAHRITTAGGAASAHRSWLLGYLDRHVTPDKFTV